MSYVDWILNAVRVPQDERTEKQHDMKQSSSKTKKKYSESDSSTVNRHDKKKRKNKEHQTRQATKKGDPSQSMDEDIDNNEQNLIQIEVARRKSMYEIRQVFLKSRIIRFFHSFIPSSNPTAIGAILILISFILFFFLFGAIKASYLLGIGIPLLASLVAIEGNDTVMASIWLKQWVVFMILMTLDVSLEPIFSFFSSQSYHKVRVCAYAFVVLAQPFSGNAFVDFCLHPFYSRNHESISQTLNSASRHAMKATNEASFTILSSMRQLFWKVLMTMGENNMNSSDKSSSQEKHRKTKDRLKSKHHVTVQDISNNSSDSSTRSLTNNLSSQPDSDDDISEGSNASEISNSRVRPPRQSRAWEDFDILDNPSSNEPL